MIERVGLGGGCYWCTETVFQALRGVHEVEPGFICSSAPDTDWSEAVRVGFDPDLIGLGELIKVHLHTHSSTSDHAMRARYRSAIYVGSPVQARQARCLLASLQSAFDKPLITRVLQWQHRMAARLSASPGPLSKHQCRSPVRM